MTRFKTWFILGIVLSAAGCADAGKTKGKTMNEPMEKMQEQLEKLAQPYKDFHSAPTEEMKSELDFKILGERVEKLASYRGRLGESAALLAEALDFDSEFDRLAERLGTYAFLKTTENQGDSDYQAMKSRFQNLSVRASQATSYMRPELLAIEESRLAELVADDRLAIYRLQIERLNRYRAHTLTDGEERLRRSLADADFSGAACIYKTVHPFALQI